MLLHIYYVYDGSYLNSSRRRACRFMLEPKTSRWLAFNICIIYTIYTHYIFTHDSTRATARVKILMPKLMMGLFTLQTISRRFHDDDFTP